MSKIAAQTRGSTASGSRARYRPLVVPCGGKAGPARRSDPRRSDGLPSHAYRWNGLDTRTFHTIGVIARRAPDGSPQFNFAQTVWLYPRIDMDWSPRAAHSTETLALNILAAYLALRPERTRRGSAGRTALSAARPFAEMFLRDMPRAGGCIPRAVILEWLDESRRS
jgi:hypothetical protein